MLTLHSWEIIPVNFPNMEDPREGVTGIVAYDHHSFKKGQRVTIYRLLWFCPIRRCGCTLEGVDFQVLGMSGDYAKRLQLHGWDVKNQGLYYDN